MQNVSQEMVIPHGKSGNGHGKVIEIYGNPVHVTQRNVALS